MLSTVPTNSDLASRLLRAFFLITNPVNYQDHRVGTWNVTLPGVPVNRTDVNNVSDQPLLSALNIVNAPLDALKKPTIPGIGEVWVDAQYEKTEDKTKPGSAVAVDTNTWKVTKRVSLPGINMNNGHNMWASQGSEAALSNGMAWQEFVRARSYNGQALTGNRGRSRSGPRHDPGGHPASACERSMAKMAWWN